eukprot:COSAG01_NODE_14179_length_1486_cov_923.805335_1_plen_20_part_10
MRLCHRARGDGGLLGGRRAV